MNIDEAINKAADHIEQYPESYNFGQGMVINRAYRGFGPNPGPGGPQACMLSRIGEMAGYKMGTNCNLVATELLGCEADTFYSEIRNITRPHWDGTTLDPVHDRQTIPAAMRQVAKKYTGIPVSVRQIFEPGPVEMVTRYRGLPERDAVPIAAVVATATMFMA